jgi:hypothetical protein
MKVRIAYIVGNICKMPVDMAYDHFIEFILKF